MWVDGSGARRGGYDMAECAVAPGAVPLHEDGTYISEGWPWDGEVLLAYVDQNTACCSLTGVLVGRERADVKDPL